MINKKLSFGLSPKSALINGILMAIVHSLCWAIRVWQQANFKTFENLNSEQINDLVEWYFFYPPMLISMWLLSDYFDHKFSKGKFVLLKRFVISLSTFVVIIMITRVLFLASLYYFF